MMSVSPLLSAEIYQIAPGFRALSIYAEASTISDEAVGQMALQKACENVLSNQPNWAESHLVQWAEVFQKFGAKPKRTPCSAQALRKRVLRDASMASLNPVVDLYNAVSLQYALPVGGENFSAYEGTPRLTLADGTEAFDTLKEGEPVNESPEKGEVIWRDDIGVTCRRWNWRQGLRTRLNASDKQMWFILESLSEMPLEALYDAGEMLTHGLEKMMPGVRTETQLVDFS